jgi:exodeoxyribonuclease VII large subunit
MTQTLHGEWQPSVVVSVGEFSTRLRDVFRRVRAFEYIGVTGEVSQWSPRASGVYFTIKDANAILECFAYHSRARGFPAVAPGTAVIAYGTVRVVERRSRYELLTDRLQLTGIGELYAQYEALKERFRAEGLFAPERKRAIPRFPRLVALVSAEAKGAEDFLTVMHERAPQVEVRLVPTRVQGVGADVEIAQAIDDACRLRPDAIVLARGGGSYEDLFAFNLEPVVRAIVRANVPVITGIGHTGDHHLADEVADLACETPSNAAQLIANLWQRGEDRLERLTAQLDREMRDLLARASQRGDAVHDALERAWERHANARRDRLTALDKRLSAQSPSQRVAKRAQLFTALRTRMDTWPARAFDAWRTAAAAKAASLEPAWQRFISRRAHAREIAAAHLDALDPLAPLARGYAVIHRNGELVRSVSQVAPGDEIRARLGRGTLGARVETVRDE